MKEGSVERIEANVQSGAAGVFAASVGFAFWSGLPPVTHGILTGPLPAIAAMIAYLLCNAALARVPRAERRYAMPIFDLRPIARAAPAEPDELLLTNAERMPPAMPTPGQLRTPIGPQPDGGLPHASPPDASQDLFAALAELRRDLN
jgi:hypothetical protein